MTLFNPEIPEKCSGLRFKESFRIIALKNRIPLGIFWINGISGLTNPDYPAFPVIAPGIRPIIR